MVCASKSTPLPSKDDPEGKIRFAASKCPVTHTPRSSGELVGLWQPSCCDTLEWTLAVKFLLSSGGGMDSVLLRRLFGRATVLDRPGNVCAAEESIASTVLAVRHLLLWRAR
eukprot:4870256-Amphidinium_carterae.1